MARVVHNWHPSCQICGRPYSGFHLRPVCSECARTNVKRAKKTRRTKISVILISFLLFPFGFFFYFILKDNKPHYAKPALYSAITFLCLYGILNFLPYLIDM